MENDRYDKRERKKDMFETVAELVERLTLTKEGKDVNGIDHDSYDEDGEAGEVNKATEVGEAGEPGGDGGDGGDDGFKIVDEIESLCMKCHENGTTRLFLTKIPFFREIILTSFYCEHCHFKNTEVQSASEIQEQGTKYTFALDHLDDMERQVVKSDTAVLRIEDLDLEIPAGHGRLTNIEGVLNDILRDLEYGQKTRKREEPAMFEKIDAVVQPLVKMMLGTRYPFTITLDDPAGNSWIEPSTKDVGNKYLRADYPRTSDQNAELGLQVGQNDGENSEESKLEVIESSADLEDSDIRAGLLYSMPCECPGCSRMVMLKAQMVDVPYFKQVIITAANCDACGYRTNDVKTGGEVPKQGRRIWLQIQGPKDLSRDILKSETCLLSVPECNVQVVPGTMAGRFTTVEGLLTHVRDDLRGAIFDIDDSEGTASDSMPEGKKKTWKEFFDKLDKAIKGEFPYTILLEDPLANSYAQSLHAPDPDPQIVIQDYDRTADEEEELGLNDIKTHINSKGEYVKEPTNIGTSNAVEENVQTISQKEKVIQDKEEAAPDEEVVIQEKKGTVQEKDGATVDKVEAVKEKEEAVREKQGGIEGAI